jgi:glycosyltransferase involved in cell wall biosynthesis
VPGLRDRLAISLRVSCLLATRTLPVSEMVGEELVSRGIPANRIQVLRSAVEAAESQQSPREEARARLGYRDEDLVVATVGRADPVKGWDVLLRAFVEARRSLPHARLLLAGSVDAPNERTFHGDLMRLTVEHGAAEAVRFTGRLPTVADVLGAADVFVLPSRSEGHSLALVEAIRAGLPCVASAVGGAPELIAPGVNGLVVARNDARALADAIVLLGRDKALRARLGAAARAGLRMPTPDEHALALQQIYRTLLRAGDPARFVATT